MISNEDYRLSVIIPVRWTKGVDEFELRLEGVLMRSAQPNVERIVLDYGSAPDLAMRIRAMAQRMSARYHHTSHHLDPFSIGAARDLGVQLAAAPVVMFNDIDFYADGEMYSRILDEAANRRLLERRFNFFCVPVIFLTEQGLVDFRSALAAGGGAARLARWLPLHWMLHGDRSRVVFTAYGSSAMVVNKAHYLALGGHNPDFFGHGAEDYELLHRLGSYNKIGQRPKGYYIDTKTNEIKDYSGFRAYFSLYGIEAIYGGVFMVHLWHPTRKIEGYSQSRRNFAMLTDMMKSFDKNNTQPAPLTDLSSDRKTLFLGEADGNAFRMLRHAVPRMGQVRCAGEESFSNGRELLAHAGELGVTSIGFTNPYGNPHRLALYRAVRAQNAIKYWTFDRGGLPDSWFFDFYGFNADSASYDRVRWDAPLAEADCEMTHAYIRRIRTQAPTLEHNDERRGADYWRRSLHVAGKRVIFVPLQRPEDTVVRHFAGPCKNFEGFADRVRALATNLDKRRFAVVVKKHPLEDESNLGSDDGVIVAPENANVYDLIEMSERVVTLNSGVGLLAMLFNRPVAICGEAYYAAEGVNVCVETTEALVEACQAAPEFNEDVRDRFLHHLLTRVYSFGASRYDETISGAGKRIRIAREVIFDRLSFGEDVWRSNLSEANCGISLDAPLFYSFGGREGVKAGTRSEARGQLGEPYSPKGGMDDLTLRQKASVRVYRMAVYPFLDAASRRRCDHDPKGYFGAARARVNLVFKAIGGF